MAQKGLPWLIGILGVELVIVIFVVAGLLLFAAASKCKYRRVRRLLASNSIGDLRQEQLDVVDNAANLVQRIKKFRDASLNVGRAIPIIGDLMDSIDSFLISAEDFETSVEGLQIAIRRAAHIKEMLQLIEQNQEGWEEVDKQRVETRKDIIVEKIGEFKTAMRQFGQQQWCSRICTVQTHISSLLQLDTKIVDAMKELKECYKYSRDAQQIREINAIRASNDDFNRRLDEIKASNDNLLELVRQNAFQASQLEVSALLKRWLRYFHRDHDEEVEMRTRSTSDVECPMHDSSSMDVSGGPSTDFSGGPPGGAFSTGLTRRSPNTSSNPSPALPEGICI